MIKGIVALFTSGLILNPLVLLGIVLGVYCAVKLDVEQMKILFADYRLYLVILIVSVVYTFSFRKVYQDDAVSLDYTSMLFSVIMGLVRFILACVLTISFVIMLFGF